MITTQRRSTPICHANRLCEGKRVAAHCSCSATPTDTTMQVAQVLMPRASPASDAPVNAFANSGITIRVAPESQLPPAVAAYAHVSPAALLTSVFSPAYNTLELVSRPLPGAVHGTSNCGLASDSITEVDFDGSGKRRRGERAQQSDAEQSAADHGGRSDISSDDCHVISRISAC